MAIHKSLQVLLALVVLVNSATRYSISPVPGDLVVNGGFENGKTGWTFTGDQDLDVDINKPTVYTGIGCAFFGSVGHPGIITQTITTVPGQVYIVDFHLNTPTAAGDSSFMFKLNGNQVFGKVDINTATGYELHTYAFTASGASTTLEFDGQYDHNYFYLDDVTVVPLPVPCDSSFYEFDPLTGNIIPDAAKKYPGPPQPDETFPVIDDAGDLLFNYKSNPMSSTFPREIVIGLAPSSVPAQVLEDTQTSCRWTQSQATGCPSFTDIGFSFSTSDPNAIQDDFETLFIKGCVSRDVALDSSTVTYSGNAFTLYMDPYNLGNPWSELKPISFSVTLPYTSQASTTSVVDVVSDVVSVEYQPLEVINQGTGSNPVIQFTTVARTLYPFVAYGAGTTFTPPAGQATTAQDSSGDGVCVLYQPSGQVAATTDFCDANPGLCTVECTRIISLPAPVCDLSGYQWDFIFNEYQDFSLSSHAHRLVDDPAQTPFSEQLLFDTNPLWNVCPTADSTDYSRFIYSSAVHGHYDTSTGDAVADPATPAAINTPLNFGFKIFVDTATTPGNPDTTSATKIYKARLTQMKVSRPDNTDFYLVGVPTDPTVGGAGPNQDHVHGLSFTPSPVNSVYDMFISAQTAPPKFASISASFIPNVGSPSGPNILYYSDSSISGGVTLTVTFSGVISLFADGSTPTSKRDVFFRRQVTFSPNGTSTYADPNQIVHSLGTENSTWVVIQVPRIAKAVNASTIAGSVVGGVIGLGLLAIAFVFYRRSKKAAPVVVQKEKVDWDEC